MGLFSKFIDKLTGAEPPSTKLKALPVEINGPRDAARQRIVHRLLNLYRVRNPSDAVLNEIERYRQAVEAEGLEVPVDAYEAELLLDKVRI